MDLLPQQNEPATELKYSVTLPSYQSNIDVLHKPFMINKTL